MKTKGRISREKSENGLPAGFEADCPYCLKTTVARYADDGSLIWWPTAESGCSHYTGCYESGGSDNPTFLFA